MGENENARMRVVVRIRPINQKELRNEEETILEQLDEKVWTFFFFKNPKFSQFQKFFHNSFSNCEVPDIKLRCQLL